MIDLDNQTTLAIDIDALEKIADTLSTKEVELMIVNDETMLALNTEYRGKESTTDVLSFPMEAPFTEQSIFGMPLGSIIIAESFVREEAKTLGHSEQDELSLLFIHGMLHLLGFDHEVDDGEMRAREKELIEAFGLPKSLILRTES
ncbi:rRNA maturation RNase YbeY [Sulfurovum sp.]|uniref:rRNA maturation RNase YbeY n=1 Tax=Sulfurovum sp. TaxID=1969726 RepID=UPI002867FDE4|nr:rRNA maturation RNase YbeY [Sulfurovum sp.]